MGQRELAAYARPRLGAKLLEILTSVVAYLAISVLMYFTLEVSYLLTLALVVPATGFLVRTFVVFHDCAHGSLLPSKRANQYLGRFLGLFVLSPFQRWRHDHADPSRHVGRPRAPRRRGHHHADRGRVPGAADGEVVSLTA